MHPDFLMQSNYITKFVVNLDTFQKIICVHKQVKGETIVKTVLLLEPKRMSP